MLTCDYFDLYQLTTLRMCLIELQITHENKIPTKSITYKTLRLRSGFYGDVV
ncbi:hypothetical protein VCRA2117O380_10541 [Vibrio crassostreae]|nr:hypothetical protein VCRA2117O379_10113 [Vibrio crassostreae]CAK1898849.1 hypothetical protein VCRA2119O382_10541 [Vibrio crassostreae]CAK1901259.1 hypothetical protein VCRA2117O380_10541 [Vibrio crassostreae]CAK1954078.1 hypothetical protein VCRA2119O381_280032 [Vibrio crassostreae]CAK2443554.1 hypothetical protein VCRA2113O350_10113 [Vibrio crassostreae]